MTVLPSNIEIVLTSADAGLRSNGINGGNNYNTNAEMKRTVRGFIMKFQKPSNLDIPSVSLTFYSDTEDNPLDVYILPYSS